MNDCCKENHEEIYICRCEEITLEEIQLWIDRGYDTFNELKHVLRVGMGPCQGRGCQDIILRELSKKTGKPISQIEHGRVRQPVKPIPIRLLAGGDV
jgi:bacterioferritin-associated ferredoxin